MTIGITGISGSGKHTAAEFFKKKDWVILNADKIAHNLYRPYTNVWKEITREFGEGILTTNDVIDRVKLGKIVFNASSPEESKIALKKLNSIVHPYIKRRIKETVHRHFRRGSSIAVVVALWRESGLENCCEKIILIKADPTLRSERMQHRDGISAETYQMRVANQTEPPHPDFVVENNGSIAELNKKLTAVLEKL